MSAVPLPPTARSERPPRSDGIVQPQGKGETEATKRDILAWYKERAATSGRPLSRDEARNRSPPPSVKKRRTSSPAADARHAQRAQHRDSGEAADVPQSSARPALPTDQIDTAHEPESGGIRLDELIDARGHELIELIESSTYPATSLDELNNAEAEGTATIPSDEPTFAHLLFDGRSEEEVADTAAKINTWRNIPKRARPKIAEMIIEIADRATSGEPCSSTNCCGCRACCRRDRAWQDFDYIMQVLMRNHENSAPSAVKTGPKVDEIIRDRVQQVKVHG